MAESEVQTDDLKPKKEKRVWYTIETQTEEMEISVATNTEGTFVQKEEQPKKRKFTLGKGQAQQAERETRYLKGKGTIVEREEMTVVGRQVDSRIGMDRRRETGAAVEESFNPHEEAGNSSSDEENQFYMPNLNGRRESKVTSIRSGLPSPRGQQTAVELEFDSRDSDINQAILEDDEDDEDEKND